MSIYNDNAPPPKPSFCPTFIVKKQFILVDCFILNDAIGNSLEIAFLTECSANTVVRNDNSNALF
ncbi:MAG: hypothetical protein F6K40_05980 [Okeania sp. SIO3I5]|uniref:hypothetical protein n=1 Tax=Okeania sp. SIO3I5 TaxID=2607805 RepID=UPI0013B6C4F9|nr:hypothetical protein [Okeania sp. SIO3I5]NEQ35856.1 hypothetical protein [Okeania sp. SIO3I5]